MSEQSSSKGFYRNASVITFFTLISRILGAVRDLVIAHFFGAGLYTDAFVQAFTIPNVLRRLTAEGSMTLVFIPLYTEIREQSGQLAARLFARKTMALVLTVTVVFTLLGIWGSPWLVYLFAAGFADDPVKFEVMVDLTRLMFPYLIFVSLVAWAMGVLNSEKRFATPAAAPILLNVGIIAFAVLLSDHFAIPIESIAWGVLCGGLLQVLIQLPALSSIQQSIRLAAFWNDPQIRRMLLLMVPSLLGVAVYQINIIVLRNIASFLPTGQVTYYYNANRLSELVLGVFAFAFTQASFPDLSTQMARVDWQGVRETMRFTMSATWFLIMPATVGLTVVAEPIVAMLYLHGKFNYQDVMTTAITLQAFALATPAVASIRLQTSVFFAMKDTKTPVILSLISLIFTGTLGWYLSLSLEVAGLALGLAAGSWLQFLLSMVLIQLRSEKHLKGWLDARSTFLYLMASLVMGGVAWAIAQYGDWQLGPRSWLNWGVFFIMLLVSVLCYFAILSIFKEEQLMRWRKILIRRFRR